MQPTPKPGSWSRRSAVLVLLALGAAGVTSTATAQPPNLIAAAIAGDLGEVRRLIDAGTAVDTADRWGGTALAFAAAEGRVEVVRFLLARGADPSKRETFFDQSPLGRALGGGPFTEGLPPERLEIALMLLRAGADDRELALATALERGNLELARAAVESGPLYASSLEEMRERAAKRGGAFMPLVAGARTRPDPPPPDLDAAELARFAGRFDSTGTDGEATVTVDGAGLRIEGLIPAATRVTASTTTTFRSDDGAIELQFFGRAGTVEGFGLRAPNGRWDLRRSVADPVPGAASKLADRARGVEAGHPASSWPGFRGVGGGGNGDDDGGLGDRVPVAWNVGSGDGVLWTAELPGLGNSSPIVEGGRVFVTTAVAAGKSAGIRTGLTGAGTEVDEAVEHRWLVLAFDARTGKKLWETEVGRGVPASKRHMKATQANSTPATNGRRIVVVFPTAGLAALDLDGRLLWKHDLGPLRAGAFNDPTLEWGFASSPVIHGQSVILQVDIHDGPYLAAWDLETGRELWRTAREGVAPSWATPVLWPTPDGVEVVANASNIRGYSASDGHELWRLGPNSEQVVAAPVIGGGILYVSAGYPPVQPIYAVKPGIRGEVATTPGAPDARLLWSADRGGAYMPTPLLYRGLLYVVHHNARVVAYDALTGDAVYKARFSQGGTFTSSPVAVSGRIYTGTEEGQIYVFSSGPAFEELAINDMGEPVMATPAIANGALYVRTPSRLIALQRPDGTVK